MAEISLADVVERIRAEGQLQRNSGTNSLKSIKDILSSQNEIMSEGFKGLVSAITADALSNKELKMENDRLNERLLEALEALRNGGGVTPTETPLVPIGGLATILAGMIGSVIGVIGAQLKAISTFAKFFTPEWIRVQFDTLKASTTDFLSRFRAGLAERIASVRAAISSGFERLKGFFSFGDDSRIGKILASLGSRIALFADGFRAAGSTIMAILEGPLKAVRAGFNLVKGFITAFGSMIGRVAGVVGKIFYPIAIVITLFDTIKGAIDGYTAEGSILGGLQGAITGFFTSLVTKPFDLIKDAVAWVLEKLGWDAGAEFLNSFSFTEIFTNLVSGVFGYIESAVNFFKSLFAWDASNPIVSALTNVSEFLTGMVQSVKDFMVESFNKIVESIQSFDLMATLGNLGNMAEEFLKGILRAVLPAADSLVFDAPSVSILGREFGGGQINLNPIPDSLYEWLNQPVPEVTPVPAASGSSGAELSAAEERLQETATQREMAAAENSGGNAQIGVDASTRIEQRSDTVYIESAMSARSPDPWANVDYNNPRNWVGG